MDVGDRIRALLAEKNISQADFARQMGVVPVVISKWVTGKVIPGGKSLEKIAMALNVPVAALVEGPIAGLAELAADGPAPSPRPNLPIDVPTLALAVQTVEEFLRQNRLVLALDKKALAMAASYAILVEAKDKKDAQLQILKLVVNAA